MIGLFDVSLRAEGLWHGTLIPEGWMNDGFILTGGGEEPPVDPPAHVGMVMVAPVEAGSVRVRRRFWWRVTP